MRFIQFTIPASGILELNDPGSPNANFHYQQMTIQNNNASGNMRVGDSTVSATVGILLYPAGGSFQALAPLRYGRSASFWVYGSAGALVDVLIIE